MKFVLPDLPYSVTSLEPVISSVTVDLHYNKHHNSYCTNLNKQIQESGMVIQSVTDEELIRIMLETVDDQGKRGIFNNAGQVFNHNFYWASLTDQGKSLQHGDLLKQIIRDFGSFEKFRELMVQEGVAQFGSGWVWLIWDQVAKKLSIVKTANADSPVLYRSMKPLFVLDVWEHAYYVDYHNRRVEYLGRCFDELVNWRFVEENFAKAVSELR